MKFPILAAAAVTLAATQFPARADVGVTEAEPPAVERRVYTERREHYVEPAPIYREEVRVYRTVPIYTTRVYREVPVFREYPVYRPAPYYRERRVGFLPTPYCVGPRFFGHW
jgi:hypothetical protein